MNQTGHIKIIIGKNFGDEGKGLMTAYFAHQATVSGSAIVIRHNGGAQAGHTVTLGQQRFVFHQLGSGSVYRCPTFWTDSFFADLLKLGEEVEAFRKTFPEVGTPQIFGLKSTKVTVLFDVLLNLLSESMRGVNKHGSCGMGIWEAYLRSQIDRFCVTLGEVLCFSEQELAVKLFEIREEYVTNRLLEIGISNDTKEQLGEEQKEWLSTIYDDDVIFGAAQQMRENLRRYVTVLSDSKSIVRNTLNQYDTIIFETAQGLLLDYDREEFYPYLTPSKTGLHNAVSFLTKYEYWDCDCVKGQEGLTQAEVCYVTRSYVTRHGAGPLPNECSKETINPFIRDLTNVPNPWQDVLRFGLHGDGKDFWSPVREDLTVMSFPTQLSISLAVTHLNETNGMLKTINGLVEPFQYWDETRRECKREPGSLYLSDSVRHEEVKKTLCI